MADCAPSIPEVSEGKSSISSGRVAPDLISIQGRESETSLVDLVSLGLQQSQQRDTPLDTVQHCEIERQR